MALFIDTFVNKLDSKGRVSVPASFRAELAPQSHQGIVAFPSRRYRAIHCAGFDWFQELNARIKTFDPFSDAHDDLTQTIFANAKPLLFDGEGRIVLPEKFVREADIGRAVAFVGRGSYFEMWEPKAYEAHNDSVRERAQSERRTLNLREDKPA